MFGAKRRKMISLSDLTPVFSRSNRSRQQCEIWMGGRATLQGSRCTQPETVSSQRESNFSIGRDVSLPVIFLGAEEAEMPGCSLRVIDLGLWEFVFFKILVSSSPLANGIQDTLEAFKGNAVKNASSGRCDGLIRQAQRSCSCRVEFGSI